MMCSVLLEIMSAKRLQESGGVPAPARGETFCDTANSGRKKSAMTMRTAGKTIKVVMIAGTTRRNSAPAAIPSAMANTV